MNIYAITLITFLFPVAVLAVGALEIFANRNKGISRTLFGVFLITLFAFFAFNLLTEVKMGAIQIVGFVLLLPFSMLAGPVLLMYQTSLMGKSEKLLGKGGILLHLIPALYVMLVLLVGLYVFTTDEVIEILTVQRIDTSDTPKLIARIVLASTHLMWYAQLIWYNSKIQKVYSRQRQKYGKYYAEYESRNEQLMLRQIVILMLVAFYDLMFWVIRVRHGYLLILSNVLFSVLLGYLVIAGREQINKKKYRMYKLSSHEDEVTGKERKRSTRRYKKSAS